MKIDFEPISFEPIEQKIDFEPIDFKPIKSTPVATKEQAVDFELLQPKPKNIFGGDINNQPVQITEPQVAAKPKTTEQIQFEISKPASTFATGISAETLRFNEIEKKIKKVEESDFDIAKHFRSGDAGSALDIASFKDMMTGGANAERINKLRDDLSVAVGTPDEKQGFVGKTIDAVAEMLPAMGKGAATSVAGGLIAPGVGVAAGAGYWASQGAGSMYSDLRREGIPHDVSIKIAAPAGALYGAIETFQVGKLFGKFTKKQIEDIAQNKAKNMVRKFLIEKGKDYVKENAEEVGQNIIQETSLEIGKQVEGTSDKSAKDIAENLLSTSIETLKQSAAPLAIIGAPATVIGARKAKQKENEINQNQPIEKAKSTEKESGVSDEFNRAAQELSEMEPTEEEVRAQKVEGVETGEVTKQDSEIKAKYANTPRAPREIVDPLGITKEEIAQTADPKLKAALQKNLRLEEDEVVKGMVKKQTVFDSIEKAKEQNIPGTYFQGDGVNMKGSNDIFKHEGTNDRMKALWGDIIQKEIASYGGIISRDQGDETYGFMPYLNEEQTREILSDIREKVRKKLPEFGLDKLPHARNKLPEVPTLDMIFGVSDIKNKPGDMSRAADLEIDSIKTKEEFDIAEKFDYIYDEEKKHYVPRKLSPQKQSASGLQPGTEVGISDKVTEPENTGIRKSDTTEIQRLSQSTNKETSVTPEVPKATQEPVPPAPKQAQPTFTTPKAEIATIPTIGKSFVFQNEPIRVTDIKEVRHPKGVDYTIHGKKENGASVQIMPELANKLMGETERVGNSLWDMAKRAKVSYASLKPFIGKTGNKTHLEILRTKGQTYTALWEKISPEDRNKYNLNNPDDVAEALAKPDVARKIILGEKNVESKVDVELKDRERAALEDRAAERVSVAAGSLEVGDKLKVSDENGNLENVKVVDKKDGEVILKDGVTFKKGENEEIGHVAPDPKTGGVVDRDGKTLYEDDLQKPDEEIPFSRKEEPDEQLLARIADENRRRADAFHVEERKAIIKKLLSKTEHSFDNKTTDLEVQEAVTGMQHIVENIAHAMGRKIIWYSAKGGIDTVNGILNPEFPNIVFLNVNNTRPEIYTFLHESLHDLKRASPKTYENILKVTGETIITGGEEQFKTDYLKRYNQNALDYIIKNGHVQEELLADFIGQQYDNQEFWNAVADSNPSINRRILYFLDKIIKRIKAILTRPKYKTYNAEGLFKDVNKLREVLARSISVNERKAAEGEVVTSRKSDEEKDYLDTMKKQEDLFGATEKEKAQRAFDGIRKMREQKAKAKDKGTEGLEMFEQEKEPEAEQLAMFSRKEIEETGAEIKGNNVILYRGGNIDKNILKKLRYGDYLSAVKTGKDATGNGGASEYGKNIVRFELPIHDVKVTNGELQYIGASKSLKGGNKYPIEIYRAYNDVYGSNYTAQEIDRQDNVIEVASQGLSGGREEFDALIKKFVNPNEDDTALFSRKEPVVDLEKEFSMDRARQLEKAERSFRGRFAHAPASDILRRAQLEVELAEAKEAKLEEIKISIYDYARSIGLNAEAYNRVDTMLKNTRTVKQLSYALNTMDEVLEKRIQRRLVTVVEEKIKDEYKRLAKLQTGKGQSSIELKYNQRVKQYLDKLTSASMAGRETVLKTLNYFNNNPAEVMPESVEKDIIDLFKQNIKTMSSDDLVKVLRDLKELKELGYLKRELQQVQEDRRFKGRVRAVLTTIKGKKEPLTPAQKIGEKREEAGKLRTRIKKLSKEYGYSVLSIERILESLQSDFIMGKPSALKDAILKPIAKASTQKAIDIEDFMKVFKEIHKGVKLDELNNVLFIAESDKNEPITYDLAMAIYAHTQNPGNLRHLKATYSQETIDKAVEMLPGAHKQIVDKMIDYFDTVGYNKMNETFKRMFQIDLPKERRYFPIQKLDTLNAENAIANDLIARFGNKVNIREGSIKGRTMSHAAFADMGYLKTISDHMRNAIHWANMIEPVKQVDKFLSNNEVREAIESVDPEIYTQLKSWLKDNAYGRIQKGVGWFDKMADFIRKNMVTSIFGLNLLVSAKQPLSLFPAIPYVGKRNMVKGLYRTMKNPFKAFEFAEGKSAWLKMRAKNIEREIAELHSEGQVKQILGEKGLWDKYKEFSTSFIQVSDRMTAAIVWNGAFIKQINLGKTEEQAIEYADEVTRKTQSTGDLVNMPKLYRDAGWSRMFTLFTSSINKNANILYEIGKTWDLKHTPENLSKIFWATMMSGMAEYMISHAVSPDDLWETLKDDPEGFLVSMGNQFLQGLPFVGDATESALQAIRGVSRRARGTSAGVSPFMVEFNSPMLDLLSDMFFEGPAALIKLASGEKLTPSQKKMLYNVAARMTGSPLIATKILSAIQKDDPRLVLWSEYSLKDLSKEEYIAKTIIRGGDKAEEAIKWKNEHGQIIKRKIDNRVKELKSEKLQPWESAYKKWIEADKDKKKTLRENVLIKIDKAFEKEQSEENLKKLRSALMEVKKSK